MEIIPIIYKFLTIGGGLLTLVIIVSYIISKTHQKEEQKHALEKHHIHPPMFAERPVHQPQAQQQQPVIFPIDAFSHREIKVVRKQSYEELDMTNRATQSNGTKNGNRRYTILNDEIKNSNYRYVNEA